MSILDDILNRIQTGGMNLGSGATGNLSGGAPTGFSMPNGSGNTLFSLPGGNAATPTGMTPAPATLGGPGFSSLATLGGANSGLGGLGSVLGKLGGALAGGGGQQQPMPAPHPMMGGAHAGAPVNFMPQSAVTSPYSLATGGVQGLLQQIMQQRQSNPLG